MDTKKSSPSLAQELDEIVRALDMPRGQLPVDAIHAARRYQDVIVPRLESLIQRAVSLSGELPMQLFGDAIHETLPLAVPTLGNHRLDEVLALIRNRDLNDFVRWAFQEGLLRLVAAGLRSREEIVGHLRQAGSTAEKTRLDCRLRRAFAAMAQVSTASAETGTCRGVQLAKDTTHAA